MTIAYGVTSIGNHAFDDCIGLTTVTIPSSVTSIGESAFQSCGALTNVTIPPSVTSIGSEAFVGCGLTTVTIPAGVTSIGEAAFWACELTSVTISYGVTSIGTSAFLWCGKLTSVTIPSSVTSIGASAFCDCGLTNITIPSSVTSIGDGAFTGCNLTTVTIPSSVTSFGNYVFSYCTGLTGVTIPSSITSIGDEEFEGCMSLTGVTIPSSVTSIGEAAFHGCTALTSVTIPSSVTSIGDDAFYGCGALTSVNICSSATSIGDYAFAGCTGLPNSHKCAYILLGGTDVGIVNYSGSGGALVIPAVVKVSGSSLPVTAIENGTFYDCTGLTGVTIPSGVTSIGNYAFCGCTGLTAVVIPSAVTSIGDYAFAGCIGLTSVTFPGNAPTTGSSVFDSTGRGFTIYYYQGKAGFSSPIWTDSSDDQYPSVVFLRSNAAYDGLLQNGSGYISINLLANGRFTGAINIGNSLFGLGGSFNFNQWQGFIGGYSISLQLKGGSGTYWITGSVDGIALDAYAAAYNSGQSAPEAGKKYTLLLASTGTDSTIPEGTGWATMTVSKTGGAIVAGQLPDGESFRSPGLIVGGTDGDQFIVESSLSYPSVTPKGAKGYLFGALTFASLTGTSDVSGTLEWIKPGQTRGNYQPAFDTTLNLIGSVYTPPKRGGGILPNFTQGDLILSDTNGCSVTQTVAFTPSNTVKLTGTVQDKLTLTVTPSTGVFKGTLVYPEPKILTTFSGVLFQDEIVGAGYFLGPNGSGTVILSGS